jgi:Anti-sigma-28 factor, FlgM
MGEDREKTVAELRQQIEQGEYRVDPTAVANAILRRIRDLAQARRDLGQAPQAMDPAWDPGQYQSECSYPDRSPEASVNDMPVAPCTTDPIHVRPTLPTRLRTLVWALRAALGGTQTHSS